MDLGLISEGKICTYIKLTFNFGTIHYIVCTTSKRRITNKNELIEDSGLGL